MNPIPTPLERMAPEFRTLSASKCSLRVCTQLPEALHGNTLEIHQVWTDPECRNQGSATALLRQVCRDADAERITLILRAEAYKSEQNGLSQSRLEKWYHQAFGFQIVQENPTIMARPAQTIHDDHA